MARPIKKGLDYFPMFTDFFDNEAVKFYSAATGATGICILVKLLCVIYKNGYFIKWTDRHATLTAWDLHDMVTAEEVTDAIRAALENGVFDQKMFEEHSVLTSKEIQEIYLMATDRKRQVVVDEQLWLTDLPKNSAAAKPAPSEKAKPAKAASAEKKARKPREKKTVPPTLEEVTAYFAEKGYRREQAEKAFAYYEAGGWKDQTGNPVKNWKQKMIAVWMKDEAKVPDNAASTGRGIAW